MLTSHLEVYFHLTSKSLLPVFLLFVVLLLCLRQWLYLFVCLFVLVGLGFKLRVSHPTAWVTPLIHFWSSYFGDGGVSKTICPGWPWATIFLLTAFQGARITGLGHRSPVSLLILRTLYPNNQGTLHPVTEPAKRLQRLKTGSTWCLQGWVSQESWSPPGGRGGGGKLFPPL
jgi:hypothetical protein